MSKVSSPGRNKYGTGTLSAVSGNDNRCWCPDDRKFRNGHITSGCVDFQPKLKLTGSVLRFIRLAHRFAKKAIYDRPECHVLTFTNAVGLIRPTIWKFDS